MICWLKLILSAVGFSLDRASCGSSKPSFNRRCGSLRKLATRLEFHPTPDSLCKSLPFELRLARRCGREKGVGIRFTCHPTSDLLTPPELPFTASPAADLRSVHRCGW